MRTIPNLSFASGSSGLITDYPEVAKLRGEERELTLRLSSLDHPLILYRYDLNYAVSRGSETLTNVKQLMDSLVVPMESLVVQAQAAQAFRLC